MRKTTKWTKAFSVLLVFSLIMIYAWSVQGQEGKGQGKGQGKGGKKPDKGGFISVCVTFRDVLNPADRIMSDGWGPYFDGTDGVSAIVGVKRGGFRLDTSGGERMVYLDFTDFVYVEPPLPLPPSNGPYDIDLRIGEECEDEYGVSWLETKLDIVAMEGGTTRYGALSINFAPAPAGKGRPSKLLYRMVFGSLASGWPVCTHGRFPVKVVRLGTSQEPLNSWTISATAAQQACLWKLDKRNAEYLGYFRMPFSIDVVEIPVVE